ncbi:MAG: hypothetical protein HKN29_09625 [Rhodothermales bacterium]|jgi:hypothetical protein|nr:hypothetical protein [Rhodothermales bacterium]
MRDLNFESRSLIRRTSTPKMRHVIAGFCRTALEDYREAGYPFGKTMDGMLLWFEYGQRTTDN